MERVEIKKMEKFNHGWSFLVGVEDLKYEVEVEKDYWKEITGGKVTPDELVKKSFEFLLAREPKESILKKFNLKIISSYFPEYEEEIT